MGLHIVSKDRAALPSRRTLPGGRLVAPPGLKVMTCLVPVSLEPYKTCQAKFLPGQERRYETHVVECAEEHDHLIRKISHQTQMPDWYGAEAGDVEFERWVKRNARGILLGRVKM